SKGSWPPSNLYDRFIPSCGYHVVPPPYTGAFMPPKPDLVFHTAPSAETEHLAFNVQVSPTKPEQALHPDQPLKTTIPDVTSIPISSKTQFSGTIRNKKACFVCKSVDHLIKDCDFHTRKLAQKNYAPRGTHKQFAPLSHYQSHTHMVPTAVLTQSKSVLNTAARPVSAALPTLPVTRPRHAHHGVTKSTSPIRRHITRSPSSKTSNSPLRVTAAKALVIIFKDDYFQEIINPDFDKIDSPFQQTSSLKPYVPNVILEKIIIYLEDEVVNLLEKKK
nr:hypothetical protein [Tanacetum cinerariifolium]